VAVISSVVATSSVAAISSMATAISATSIPVHVGCRDHVHKCASLHAHNALSMRNQ
jgi:hypothetical protein